MSLVRFKIENHPQQVGKRGAKDTVDERITPEKVYGQFASVHQFTLDAAASAANAKCATFFDKDSDGLKQVWAPHRVWCNPPYSQITPWVYKAHQEFDRGCPVIVMLLPANRTEQAWWQVHVEPFRDKPGGSLRAEFLPKRINFGVPGNETGKWHSSAPFGCVALTWSAQ